MHIKKILLILPFITFVPQQGSTKNVTLHCLALTADKFKKDPPSTPFAYTHFVSKMGKEIIIKVRTPDDWRALKKYDLKDYPVEYKLTGISSPDGQIDKEDGRPLCVYTFSFDGLTFSDGKNDKEVSVKYQGDVTDCKDIGPGTFSCDKLSAPATR